MPICAESTWEAERTYIDQTIRYWAHVRSRSFCRTTEDCEDLSQDLCHHLWKQLDHYDPNRAGRRTFIAMVVESRFLTLRRSARLKSCGEPMRIIAFVLDQPTIERILDHIGEPTQPPTVLPARSPPQLEFGFDQTSATDDWPEMDQTAGRGADGWE